MPTPPAASPRIPLVPASYFGMVLGLAGLGGTWRAAHLAWGLPSLVGEVILLIAGLVWVVVTALYALKWIVAREAALVEAAHPIQCCFIGLAGVATMLVAGGLIPYSHGAALALYIAGAVFTLGFAIWRTGGLWLGERDHSHTTAVLYLPTVAGSFVIGTVGGALGLADLGQFFFGMGFFGWLAIESVLLHRMLTAPNMASALRPTLGIQLAPPVVGAVSLIAVAPQAPFLFAHAMIGYGVMQALIILRLLPWILREPFAPSYWAFTFGVTALATAPIRLIALGDDGTVRYLAPVLFVFANAVVLIVALGTLHRLANGRLLTAPAPSPLPAPPARADG
ncbi:dicarboxylate transporter/tellurite-resistance protein TehA [Ancylobacter sp. A5.8]|uniref:dicarboxylate transporter/tellurite-resistance protein TehA n=1 Tax=Ancylobacter gelatini TaxID=2919920 RepID=UPI001F4D814C|nr:dicarboxylate transporter/tellurite-resistance protein TehA [Ancylobacter gelatini]MCJ8144042.1 dicarboxylate transporter/tellurite-resistance protein TehA [Ancylobacter gelatini]